MAATSGLGQGSEFSTNGCESATSLSPPRIPPVRREEWTNATRDVFAVYEGKEGWENGSKFHLIHMLANHPVLAQGWLSYNKVLTRGHLPAKLRELVILRVARLNGSDYEWSMHVDIGQGVGVGPEHFAALQQGPEATLWSDLERHALRAADQLCTAHDIDEQTWNFLARELDVRQLLELLFLIGSYTMLSWIFAAIRLPLEGKLE